MTLRQMDHVGIAVGDLREAIDFFEAIGFTNSGGGSVSGEWVGRVIGLEDVRTEIAMLEAPGGGSRVELFEFKSPPAVPGGSDAPANGLGIRHIALKVDDLDATLTRVQARGYELVGEVEQYEDVFRLCYLRGPEQIIVSGHRTEKSKWSPKWESNGHQSETVRETRSTAHVVPSGRNRIYPATTQDLIGWCVVLKRGVHCV